MSHDSMSMLSTPNFHRLRGQMLGIESLRFLIAWWVVFGHHYLRKSEINSTFFYNLEYNNQGSVFAFIVISGFVTHWTSRDNQFSSLTSVATYMKRRYMRIYMAYGLAVFFAFIMRWPGVSISDVTVSKHLYNTAITALGLQSWFTWTAAGVYSGPAFSLAAPFWTISSLIFCWAMYPLVSRFFIQRGSISVATRDTLLIFILGVVHRLLRPGNRHEVCSGWGPYQGWWWYPPNTMTLFLLGMYGAELAASLQCYRDWVGSSRLCAIAIDLLFLIFFVLNGTNWDVEKLGLHYSLDCYFRTAPVLLGCILCTMRESFILGSRFMFPLQYLGKYSLAIYVFQTPFAQLFKGITESFPVAQWPHFHLAEFYTYFVCLLAFSIAYGQLIEARLFSKTRALEKEPTRSFWATTTPNSPSLEEETHKYLV